jgi:hypothetical protein
MARALLLLQLQLQLQLLLSLLQPLVLLQQACRRPLQQVQLRTKRLSAHAKPQTLMLEATVMVSL